MLELPFVMDADTKKTLAAVSSVIWSGLLTAMKFIVGIMTGSLGILSEALHSALDLLAAFGTLFAVKVAARPADDDHPYGHGKIENLMALGETLLLLATAAWVIWEAAKRLLSDDPNALHIEISLWAFAVVIISLIVDINRAAMLKRVAKETKSAALEADAAHFATDIWSSAAVLLGITGAALSNMAAENSWLHWLLIRADVFASLIVALLILHICKDLGMQSINNLMDKENRQTAATLRQALSKSMPFYPVGRMRVREVGNKAYVEMTVSVPKDLHIDTAHEIADAIELLVANILPEAETIIHMQPAELEATTPEMLVRQIALTHRFGVHGLVMLHSEQGFIIFVDLELPGKASLNSWHIAIQAFRNEVRRKLNADRVIVHAEPDVRTLPLSEEEIPDDWNEQVQHAMMAFGAPLPTDIKLYTQGSQRLCIVTIPPEQSLTVADSHQRLSLLTKKLTAALPHVARIIVSYC